MKGDVESLIKEQNEFLDSVKSRLLEINKDIDLFQDGKPVEPVYDESKRAYNRSLPKEYKKTDYMRNCIYWIEEFIEDRADIEKLRSVTTALQVHLSEIRQKYIQPK